ncbi:MAG TPA: DUF3810 family protein [Gemmatimonadetes bacterium]|nr:DUF3810 family protein [Gemmatimonadota bacterium]
MATDRVKIPNQATYAPFALADVFILAPLASRLLLGATVPGRIVQALSLGAYAGSALSDWWARKEARPIDFEEAFGQDPANLESMSDEARQEEVKDLVAVMNRDYKPSKYSRKELAEIVNEQLTEYIASVTGQRVETSSEVRDMALSKVLFPFALGACDILSGDVTIFRDTGVFEPHIITHEFCHRKGYYKELQAQAIAYLALSTSDDPVLVQSALAERTHRDLKVLADSDFDRYHELVDEAGLREELAKDFHAIRPEPSAYENAVWTVMKPIMEERMKMTGQNGLSDYDVGFTDFLHKKG